MRCNLTEEERIREQVRQLEIAEINYRSDISNAENKGRETGKAEKIAELVAKWKAKVMTYEEIQSLLAD